MFQGKGSFPMDFKMKNHCTKAIYTLPSLPKINPYFCGMS